MDAHTPGPWFVSGTRFRMNGGEWHSVNRYDERTKRDENIACVGFEPRTGAGLSDARLIAAAPELLEALLATQFGFNHSRCPVCAGFNVGPNGETDRAHTKDCIVGRAIAKATPTHTNQCVAT